MPFIEKLKKNCVKTLIENIYISWGPDTQMSISSYYFNSGNTSIFILIDTKTKPPKHCMHFIKTCLKRN